MTSIKIGYLLRASTLGCVAGCTVEQVSLPALGGMVKIALEKDLQVYGIISDLTITDDGLVRQLATSTQVAPEVIADNRANRTVPVEISVLFIGYEQSGRIRQLLPPRPPLSLDEMYNCSEEEMRRFTAAGLGYLRQVLRDPNLPTGEILAAHLRQAGAAHQSAGEGEWLSKAVQEVIVLLRDDYARLNEVLNTVKEIYEEF